MKRDVSFEDKIVEVNDTDNYYVLKETVYEGKIYLFANELEDEETPGKNMAILRVDNDPDGLYVALESDERIIKDLIAIFQNLMVSED